jgi:uncharacterized glyoxalase superfamily protein PhnB
MFLRRNKTRGMKVTSILFWVQENRASEKFYRKLGFEVVRSDDGHSVVRLGDFEITLVNMRDEAEFARDSMAGEKGKGMYVYVHVDDVDAKYHELLKKGYKPATAPRDWNWGNREFVLKDPDGYKLVFFQRV